MLLLLMKTLFRFRQDLRLTDNTWLIQALYDSKEVVPVFIFDTDILDTFPKPDARLCFLINAVYHLQTQLQEQGSDLIITVGKATDLIPQLMQQYSCTALYHNRSYGYGSLTRDIVVQTSCSENGWIYKNFSDYLLVEPGDIEQRKVFTPFFNLWKKVEKRKPSQELMLMPKLTDSVKSNWWDILYQLHTLWYLEKQYNNIEQISHLYRPIDSWKLRFTQDFSNYDISRNTLWEDGTTKLSPYLRFWLVSIRQIYQHFCDQHTPWSEIVISELARREFWHHVMHYFPETRSTSFQEKRRHIQRENNPMLFKMRCEWKTGYPIIDAAMRQLHQENWMHNRARMIVASFLTKDLLIDWTWWEHYFAEQLLDYDSAVNIGNRQRSASVGADPKPLRIFSPILQAQRFDPQAIYIKKYLPELADIPADRLHDPLSYRLPYIAPIVDHAMAQRRAKEVYK